MTQLSSWLTTPWVMRLFTSALVGGTARQLATELLPSTMQRRGFIRTKKTISNPSIYCYNISGCFSLKKNRIKVQETPPNTQWPNRVEQ